ncbi:hypothetical protein CERSUDRAFT_91780 [Gelatoporia subvermispora B]|uniref:Uncharacterized protein n=1 Tax=Ceriporiopsis subvermispora (strain B) TaxID=914234 RepID=M2R9D8_CERS8|nr:hypothetical protein CERSUDRAFT_91780 [Gelatoporia subvermispora B]
MKPSEEGASGSHESQPDLVPEPRTANGSLRRSMNVDEATFKDVCTILRNCASTYLDDSKPFRAQEQARVETYRQEAAKRCTVLSGYRNAWPAIHYVRRNFPRRLNRASHQKNAKDRSRATSPEVRSAPSVPVKRESKAKAVVSAIQTRSQRRHQEASTSTAASTGDIVGVAATSKDQSTQAVITPDNSISTQGSSNCLSGLVLPPRATWGQKLATLSFELFLDSLNPSIRDLHGALIKSGVNNAAQFCISLYDYHRVRSALEALSMRLLGS